MMHDALVTIMSQDFNRAPISVSSPLSIQHQLIQVAINFLEPL